MPLTEHSLYLEVVYQDGQAAPFTRIRVDTEFKNAAGETVVCPLVELKDDAEENPPYLLQYKLKDPNAVLWLVLVDGNKEERQKIIETQHRYIFGNKAATPGRQRTKEPRIVNIFNHFHSEVSMPKYEIKGGNIGAVGDHAKAERFTQLDNRQLGLPVEDLSTLVKELPILMQALMKRANTSEQFEAISHVKAAEEAAQKNDTQGVLNRLKSAGSWVLEVAKSVGTEVVAKVIAHAMGLG